MNNARIQTEIQRALGQAETPAEKLSDEALIAFLDALILERRGPPTSSPTGRVVLTNNLVLKKLRIALDLKEPKVLELMEAGGLTLTSRELTPLFRKHGSTHHRVCSNAVLEAFLTGLAARSGRP